MATVTFTVTRRFPFPAMTVWEALVDWTDHGRWIPATRVRILEGDGGVGTRFVARSGFGPLAFDDTMNVVECDPHTFTARVEKTGPLLRGDAGFALTPAAHASELAWFEQVRVPYLPQLFAPTVARIAAVAFIFSLQRLELHLRRRA